MNLLKTTINGVEIPLEKICDFCDGDGERPTIGDYIHPWDCPHCRGTGKTWIYYTPDEIEELTGEEWDGDCYVFNGQAWESSEYFQCVPVVAAIPGQPAPPTSYRMVK